MLLCCLLLAGTAAGCGSSAEESTETITETTAFDKEAETFYVTESTDSRYMAVAYPHPLCRAGRISEVIANCIFSCSGEPPNP